ncbi:MAG: DUF3151 domain-containing protein [Actinomycetota bacterium]|jgi:hypothetical protein|nr:DUF3151 domain-containing protein [Actinomycetota bacterium]|tara:strand:+ start:3271 stop:3711 length:441 start_codon:yes stop_codon:yes gene_type:complete
MSEQPIQLSAGRLPETVIATYDEEAITALSQALAASENEKKQRVAGVAATWPRYLDAWVALGQLSTEPIERYAYFRVGYHRGLDTLRASGWKGSGYVRWVHESNRGFLRALRGLALSAQAIGETDEADRCAQFLGQLDPSGVPETE